MSYLKYNYSLLSNSKLYSCTFSGYSSIIDSFIFKYRINEFDFLKQASINLDAKSNTANSKDLSLLPLAVRYVSPDNSMYVIERPPFQIEVDFSTQKSYDFRKSPKYLNQAKIWIPWTVCIVNKSYSSSSFSSNYSFSIFFNSRPLQSFDESLTPCFLPNSSGGNICMGQDSSEATAMVLNNSSISDLYNHLFNSYFSGWNCDLQNNLPYPEYFAKNGIISRIKDSKLGPKNYDALHGSRSVSKTYNQMLYLLSQLTLEETLDYIQYSNDIRSNLYANTSYLKNLTNIISSYNNSYQQNRYNYHNNNPSILIDQLTNQFNAEAITSVNVQLSITDIKSDKLNEQFLNTSYNNPYVIAKIYQKYKELLEQDYFDDNYSFSISLTAEEIIPYSLSMNQETYDALTV